MQLFQYQQTGARALADSQRRYLGDEPGLGKTAQVVTAADRVRAKRILVVCPASLKTNWAREFDKFSAADRPVTIIQNGKGKVPQRGTGLVIVNYDLLINKQIHSQLRAADWDVVAFDEAHALKNPEAKRTRAALGEYTILQNAGFVWPMSGTPTPNHAGELYPMLLTQYPQAVRGMSYTQFLNYYCYTKDTEYGLRVLGNKPTIGQLKAAIEGYMLRRRRVDVLPDLPDLRITTRTVDNDKALAGIRELERQPEIAAMLGSEDAAEEMEDWVAEAPMATLRKLCGMAKAQVLVDEVSAELNAGMERIVLMCWHHDTMNILHAGLAKYGVARVDGKVKPENRQNEVDKFNGGSDTTTCRVFIGQIQAAGEGLTMTSAHDMLIVEPSWVPKDNTQAMLRILRIGQQHDCLVQFVSLAGTMDEIIMAVAARKAQMVAELLGD